MNFPYAKIVVSVLLLFFTITACDSFNSFNKIDITINDAGNISTTKAQKGISVENVITSAGIKLNPLDKVIPSKNTSIESPITITITRVTEEYVVEDSILPFEQQTVKNESLQQGQKVLIQAGVNGKTQTIYRVVYENGVKISNTFVSSEVIEPAQPEIVMIGVQSPYSVQEINGTIAYISSGNAWVMESTTGNRRALTTTGNLDGRIFALSEKRDWLLYSTSDKSESKVVINRLWIVSLISEEPKPKDTGIANVVNYAEWVPGKDLTISYSTAEISSSPPFWNANNNLIIARFDASGNLIDKKSYIDTNSGGLYGWWGTSYKWSPDGKNLAFSRPDSVGFVNLDKGSLEPVFLITPYQTESVWAWVPNISWSADSKFLYSVLPESSTTDPLAGTNLSAINVKSNQIIPIVKNCGLFCSSMSGITFTNQENKIAFLSAILPDQSEVSRYNLFVMDKDGSNQKKLYPTEGVQGLKSQNIYWEPASGSQSNIRIAFIAQGNLLLVDPTTGAINQITGDGSIERIDWK